MPPVVAVRAPRWAAQALTDGGVPDIIVGLGRSRSAGGRLVASSVVFDITRVRSACSSGGRPLEPLVLWGFDDSVVMANSGLPDEVPRNGYSPLPSRSVVRIDSFGPGVPYTRTFVNVRRIADPQRLWINPINGVATYGLAATMVLADVYGRCAFGHRVVVADDPMWVPVSGFPQLVVTHTDPVAQKTQQVTCTRASRIVRSKSCPGREECAGAERGAARAVRTQAAPGCRCIDGGKDSGRDDLCRHFRLHAAGRAVAGAGTGGNGRCWARSTRPSRG